MIILYVRMYVCTNIRMCIHVYIHMCVLHVHTGVRTYYVCICSLKCESLLMFVHLCIGVYVHTYLGFLNTNVWMFVDLPRDLLCVCTYLHMYACHCMRLLHSCPFNRQHGWAESLSGGGPLREYSSYCEDQ